MDYNGIDELKRKRETKNKKPSKITKIWPMILAALVVFWLVFSLKDLVLSKLVNYETASWGILENKIPLRGAMLHKEKVVLAPATGAFSPIISQGEKVPAGTVIGYINTLSSGDDASQTKIPVKSPMPGLVSFYPDGLEIAFKQNIPENLDREKIAAMMQAEQGDPGPQTQGEAGKPLLKIVDNLVNPYFYFILPSEQKLELKIGEFMTVEFSPGMEKTIKVIEIQNGDAGKNIIGEIYHSPDLALKSRFCNFNLISASYKGIIVSGGALVSKEDQEGIFILRDGCAKWVEVKVIGQVKDKAVIKGIEIGNEYVLNPALVREGQRIF